MATAVFLVGVCGTAAIASVAARTTQSKDAERFAASVQRLQQEIHDHIRDYAAMMQAVGAYAASAESDKAGVDAFVKRLNAAAQYPALVRIAYVRSADRPSDPDAARAVTLARDSGDVAISNFVDRPRARAARMVTLYVPVYENGIAPPEGAPRRDRFRGYVWADLKVPELVSGVFGTEVEPRIAFALYEGTPSPGTLVFSAPAYNPGPARFSFSQPFQRGGYTWTLSAHSSPGLDLISSRGLVPQIFIAGFFLSVLLAALTALEARARRTAQQLLASEREARADAERMSRMKDEFLATLSHELRTPLNAIIGWTHMLREMRLPDHTRLKALETVQRNAQIQAQLIGDLLDMSRIVAGKGRLDLKPVDLNEVIDTALNVVRPSAAEQNLQMHARVAPNLPLINGDPERLQQVLTNLLTNAIKFTPEGGRIEIDARAEDGDVRVTVKDTGMGIDRDFLPYVFERFRQADASTTRAHGGLGLGLSIAKSLVEMHGGTIRADSDGRQSGATFTITLPAMRVAEAADESRAAS